MNAQELYAIVSKAKRWPMGVTWAEYANGFINDHDQRLYDDHAEMLFESALTRALPEGTFVLESAKTFGILRDVGHACMWYPSRVAALAAALVAMDGGGE